MTNADACKTCYPLVKGAEATCREHRLEDALAQARDVLRDERRRGAYIPEFVFERIDWALRKDGGGAHG